MLERFPHLECENVEPSAHFGDGDVSDRLFRDDPGPGPSQIFAGTCSECHKSSRGLLKKVPAASLPGFLRQHYTTNGEMAAVLSAYLISNGAADRRLSGGQSKPGTDIKPGTDAKPDETRPADQAERRGRKRPAPADTAIPADDGQTPAQAAIERGPDGRRSAARLRRARPATKNCPGPMQPRPMRPRPMRPRLTGPRPTRQRLTPARMNLRGSRTSPRTKPPRATTAGPRSTNPKAPDRQARASLKLAGSMHRRQQPAVNLRYCVPTRFRPSRLRRSLLLLHRLRRLPVQLRSGPRSRPNPQRLLRLRR
jgi:hypothetical protein